MFVFGPLIAIQPHIVPLVPVDSRLRTSAPENWKRDAGNCQFWRAWRGTRESIVTEREGDSAKYWRLTRKERRDCSEYESAQNTGNLDFYGYSLMTTPRLWPIHSALVVFAASLSLHIFRHFRILQLATTRLVITTNYLAHAHVHAHMRAHSYSAANYCSLRLAPHCPEFY